jgi:hypothetical protein
MTARPEWCQDLDCTPDARTQDKRDGGSGFCCGRTADLMISERQGIRHENDGHFCIRSSRGVVMLEVCEEDLQVIARNALRGLVARGRRRFSSRWFTGLPGMLEGEASDE